MAPPDRTPAQLAKEERRLYSGFKPECCSKAVVNGRDRYNQFHWHQCLNAATKDGFCERHHPDYVNAKRETARVKAEERAMKADRIVAHGYVQRCKSLEDLKRLQASINLRLMQLLGGTTRGVVINHNGGASG